MQSINPAHIDLLQRHWTILATALNEELVVKWQLEQVKESWNGIEAARKAEHAFHSALEKFHSLYDILQGCNGIDYYSRPATSLILVLRNAIHHSDHELFSSLACQRHEKLLLVPPTELLLATPSIIGSVGKFYLPLYDFYHRLEHSSIHSKACLYNMWDLELRFNEIHCFATSRGIPSEHVFVNVFPIFSGALRQVVVWLNHLKALPVGDVAERFWGVFVGSKPGIELQRYALLNGYEHPWET